MDTTKFGQSLRERRRSQGFYTFRIASALHLSETTIRCFERGERQIPLDLLSSWALLLEAPEVLSCVCQECPVKAALATNRPQSVA